MAVLSAAGVASGLAERWSATKPETTGVADDVPQKIP